MSRGKRDPESAGFISTMDDKRVCLACVGNRFGEIGREGGFRDSQFGSDDKESGVGGAVPVVGGRGGVGVKVC